MERETRPPAAITVADALVDREQAIPEPKNVMCESGAHSLARDRRRAKPVMTSTVLVFYDCCRAGIAELLEADADIAVVQATIDAYALAPEEKDALWLWAMGRRLGSSDRGDAPDDGSRRSPLPSGGERRFSGRIGLELAALRGKNLGACLACGRPVFLAHAFTRSQGSVAHVRCSISARTPLPLAPAAHSVAADSDTRAAFSTRARLGRRRHG